MPKSKKKDIPSYQNRSVIDSLVAQSGFKDELNQYSKTIQAPIDDLKHKTKAIFKEMTAHYSPLCFSITRTIFPFLYKPIFESFEVSGHIQDFVDNPHTAILLPSHRSHIDYLFLSYILDHYDIAPPHIAAGINLSFFPMGPIFRKHGAFFIRRKIGGNILYLLCLKAYLRWLVHYPVSIELFIEGGRSRDGKLRAPQTGILQLILDALDQEKAHAYKIRPVSISYDFTPDVFAYAHEEYGFSKKKENAFSLLRTFMKIEKYHRVYFHFLEPISIQQWVEENGTQKDSIRKLSQHVMHQIQENTVVTANQIIACSVITVPGTVFEDDLYQTCLQVRNYLINQNVLLSDEAKEFEKTYPELLRRLCKKGWFIRQPGYRYNITAQMKVVLNYYKYSILHYFVPVLLSIIDESEKALIKDILAYEFPTLSPKFLKTPPSIQSDATIQTIAKSILVPYARVLQALHKESLDKIIHSLSIDPEKEIQEEQQSTKKLTYQKIKHAFDFLSQKNEEERKKLSHIFEKYAVSDLLDGSIQDL
ncbi:MAG: 1-acyl-sn-glycerol-3-phosphate acyltransferase [Bdellovibrionales bacterium]|nr:1-acyl-sn-glycerol-3-phosphate acyltransferase [Bdellovibrionales bacterium]